MVHFSNQGTKNEGKLESHCSHMLERRKILEYKVDCIQQDVKLQRTCHMQMQKFRVGRSHLYS
jgi:hypothetical protein